MLVEALSALALLAPGERTVTCAETIDQTRFPRLGNLREKDAPLRAAPLHRRRAEVTLRFGIGRRC